MKIEILAKKVTRIQRLKNDLSNLRKKYIIKNMSFQTKKERKTFNGFQIY